MKLLLPIISLIFLQLILQAQENDNSIDTLQKQVSNQENEEDSTSAALSGIDEADTSYFTVGKKKVEIIERNDSTYVKIWDKNDELENEHEDYDCGDENENSFDWEIDPDDKYKFRGHWAGFEFGLNNYVDENFSLKRTPENEFMDVNTNKSWNFNINFAQYSLPFNSQYFGLVTGMGIEWSNYHFAHSNTIIKNAITQEIEPKPLDLQLRKNRLQTTYITVPLLIELQFIEGPRKDRLYIAAGVIGGIKLGANTKYTYTENGSKKKHKSRGDFYLRPFRYALTGRLGYKLVRLYMNYHPVSLFLDEKGPELYPVAMGFCITF